MGKDLFHICAPLFPTGYSAGNRRSNTLFGAHEQRGLQDIITDLASDLIGAIITDLFAILLIEFIAELFSIDMGIYHIAFAISGLIVAHTIFAPCITNPFVALIPVSVLSLSALYEILRYFSKRPDREVMMSFVWCLSLLYWLPFQALSIS